MRLVHVGAEGWGVVRSSVGVALRGMPGGLESHPELGVTRILEAGGNKMLVYPPPPPPFLRRSIEDYSTSGTQLR